MTRTATSLLAALALAFGTTTALAQSTGGSPSDPTTNENQQPGPGVGNPTDPAAGSDPAARVPTSPAGTGSASEGLSTGAGGYDSPAGIAADPNTNENQQPAPNNINPADPEAGSNPAARVPTEPE